MCPLILATATATSVSECGKREAFDGDFIGERLAQLLVAKEKPRASRPFSRFKP
jgi:hypothetical protein